MSNADHGAAAYVLGALRPAERRDFEQHLNGCPECRRQLGDFAGLPALLALAVEDDFVESPAVASPPPDLLPRLLGIAAIRRRRRRWWNTVAAAAALAAVTLGAVLVFRPAASPAASAGVSVAMTPLTGSPVAVSLQLTDRKWGTAITIICNYPGGSYDSTSYTLAVIDRTGAASTAGSWSAIEGTTTMSVATALHPNQIAALEVRLPDGTPVLRANRS